MSQATTVDLSTNATAARANNWEAVVSGNIETLHQFMRFLVRSLCVENMLFIIEIMQCKKEFIKADSKNGDLNTNHPLEKEYGVVIQLYDTSQSEQDIESIPRSTIVYRDNRLSIFEQIKMIYDKYIADTAALQINISFKTRKRIQSIIFGNNVDDNILIRCFDDAISEIRVLLSASQGIT